MIGDWVQVMDAATGTPYNCRVRYTIWPSMENALIGLDNKEISVSSLPAECLYPIPITPEILEKNGFERRQVDYLLHIDESQYLDYYPHEGSLERIYIHKDGSREVVFRVNAISYVHLLQHALKLCGIEKEWTI